MLFYFYLNNKNYLFHALNSNNNSKSSQVTKKNDLVHVINKIQYPSCQFRMKYNLFCSTKNVYSCQLRLKKKLYLKTKKNQFYNYDFLFDALTKKNNLFRDNNSNHCDFFSMVHLIYVPFVSEKNIY